MSRLTFVDRLGTALPALALVVVSFVACAHPRDAERVRLADMAAQHAAELAELRSVQQAFERDNPSPTRQSFGPLGLVVVHQSAVVGRPQKESLRVHMTWVNDTDRRSVGVVARLVVGDAQGRSELVEEFVLAPLVGTRFTPGSSSTMHAEIALQGLHLRPGWRWRIELAPLPPRSGAQMQRADEWERDDE